VAHVPNDDEGLLDRAGRELTLLERILRVPAIGVGIVVCSVMGAVVGDRAATWASRGGDYDQSALQNLAVREQVLAGDRAKVNQDIRVFGTYAEAINLALALESQARRVRSRDPALARDLTQEAQAQRNLARGFGVTFQSVPPDSAKSGAPTYDPEAALKSLKQGDSELLSTQNTSDKERARLAHNKATDFIAVGTLWVGGLFFLTLAEVTRRSKRLRRIFGLSGFGLGLVAAGLMVGLWFYG
jgi:hypothetical protein